MRAIILAIAVTLCVTPALACDGLHLNVGFGKDSKGTFDQTASDFRLEYSYKILYIAYQHHSTLETGWPFNNLKDKNTSDMIVAGIRVRLW